MAGSTSKLEDAMPENKHSLTAISRDQNLSMLKPLPPRRRSSAMPSRPVSSSSARLGSGIATALKRSHTSSLLWNTSKNDPASTVSKNAPYKSSQLDVANERLPKPIV
jgi:hypothetical protein